MTKTGPNTKENLQNRRKTSRQSKEYKKTRKNKKCEDLCCSSYHDGFHRAAMEAACWPRKQHKKIWRISVHRATIHLIVVRWHYLATKLMKRTGLVIILN
ncbi:hypothetical protein QL285_093648 [Trifolium repens]|nr:hypothetical protein QL285_093648 [Trifolium repens]